MVKAILDGRKTVTRRIVTPQAPAGSELFSTGLFYVFTPGGARGPGVNGWTVRCPFAHVDLLWVRERFRRVSDFRFAYRADGYSWLHDEIRAGGTLPIWRPSIFMPRAASRITLEITGVRVERLQEISEVDAKAEGCALSYDTERMRGGTWRGGFRDLWDTINAKRAPWSSNPWVWVIEFKRTAK